MKKHELHWLAGLLEGEGSFGFNRSNPHHRGEYVYPLIQIVMTDTDILERVITITGIGRMTGPHKIRKANHTPTYAWKISGEKAALIMTKIYPLMGTRRQARIREVLAQTGWATP